MGVVVITTVYEQTLKRLIPAYLTFPMREHVLPVPP